MMSEPHSTPEPDPAVRSGEKRPNILDDSRALLDDVHAVLDSIDPESPRRLLEQVQRAHSIFIAGAGRTGYIARAFAMRLMHLGFLVHVVGETTAPAPTAKDLLIAFSGSGQTLSTCEVEARALARNVPTLAITANSESQLAQDAHESIVIPIEQNRFPLGTLFEASLYIFLDSCILAFRRALDVSEETMSSHHA